LAFGAIGLFLLLQAGVTPAVGAMGSTVLSQVALMAVASNSVLKFAMARSVNFFPYSENFATEPLNMRSATYTFLKLLKRLRKSRQDRLDMLLAAIQGVDVNGEVIRLFGLLADRMCPPSAIPQ
jgi:hypothetical protein